MNKKYSYSTKKTLILLLVLYTILMTIFSFTDLSISLSLVDMESFWGKSAEILSEIPLDIMMMLSFSALFVTRDREKKGILHLLFEAVCIIGTVEYAFFISFFSIRYISMKLSLIIGGVTCLPLALLSVYIMNRITKGREKEFRRASAIVVLSVLCEEAVVNLLKVVVSRPRMRDITAPYTDYIPWYRAFSSSLKGDSFPSGHTAKAAGVFFLVLLADIYESLRKKKYVFITLGVIWTLSIAAGRIIRAAHFASDVTSGAFFMLFLFILIRHIYDETADKGNGTDVRHN